MASDIELLQCCRFCGLRKSDGKSFFTLNNVDILFKIKNAFPDDNDFTNPTSILPKVICNSCEASINHWVDFCESVRHVQQSLLIKIRETGSKINRNENLHSCVGYSLINTIRLESHGHISCYSCNETLYLNQISPENSYCICHVCGFKDDIRLFLNMTNLNIVCPNPKCLKMAKPAEDTTAKQFKCNTCDKSYKSKSHLNRHALTHSGPKPFVCTECGTGFWQKSSLNTHLLVHNNTMSFSCKWCGQNFRHKQTLNNHIVSIHGMDAPSTKHYNCDKCPKKFVHKDKLLRHSRSHTGEKPFKCDICSKLFSQKINLKIHLRRHENENQFSADILLRDTDQVDHTHSQPGESDLIQEIFRFNMNPEPISLSDYSMTAPQYSENTITMKNSTSIDETNDLYFNNPGSPYEIYSGRSILYDLESHAATHSLSVPDFANLNHPKTDLGI